MLGTEVICAHRASPTERVHLGRHLLLVDLVQQRREQIPGGLQPVAPDEEVVVAHDHVQDEALV